MSGSLRIRSASVSLLAGSFTAAPTFSGRSPVRWPQASSDLTAASVRARELAGIGRMQRTDHGLGWGDRPRIAWQLQDHARPDRQRRHGRAQQRLEICRRVHEADQPRPQVARWQRAGVARQRQVASGLDQRHAWGGPAVDAAGPVAGLQHVQPDQRAGPIREEPVPQARALLGCQQDHGSVSHSVGPVVGVPVHRLLSTRSQAATDGGPARPEAMRSLALKPAALGRPGWRATRPHGARMGPASRGARLNQAG